MLVLTRELLESIDIGPDIQVTFLSIRGNKIRLGIKAPDHVKVLRHEITLKLQEQGINPFDPQIDLDPLHLESDRVA